MWAGEAAHVFYDTKHFKSQFVAEGYAPPDIIGGYRLRGCHDQGGRAAAGKLGHCQRLVAGSRGRVYHKIVKFPPVAVLQELLYHIVLHRASPDYGVPLVLQEKSYRDYLQIRVHFYRFDFAVRRIPERLSLESENPRYAGSVQVYIDKPGLFALHGKRIGQIYGHGALTDTAFARKDKYLPAYLPHAVLEIEIIFF